MKFAYDTNVGQVRHINQDCACVLKNDHQEIFGIVCDGMGGHLAGEQASKMALDSLCQSFLRNSPIGSKEKALTWLNNAIYEANKEIYDDALFNSAHKGMGTTVACCLILEDIIIIGHVGDSRIYLFDENHLVQLTKDHTYVNLLVDSGMISKEQAKSHPKKNILMKALGVFEDVTISTSLLENKHQTLLLCSDGLYNALSDEQMIDVLVKDVPLEKKVLDLIDSANNNGGPDNISVVLIDGGSL